MKLVNPEGLPKNVGFSHIAIPGDGEPIFIAGQTGHRADGSLDEDLVSQFGQACRNIEVALEAVGARPKHVASILIFVTDVGAYRAALPELGEAYRAVFGRHFPAMTLIGVTELFDPKALVELQATGFLKPPE